MGLIREPLDVDFTVDPRPLTKAEKNAISEYIRDYKMKETEKKLKLPANNKIAARKRASVKQ
jgi:hypothetical protein